jgi:predicted acylesterase/phospholipase RssA
MASGANRGAYYAGFPGSLQEAGIDFELMAGVSAGGIAAAWIAAGDPEAMIHSWRQADPWRIAPHPWMSFGRLRTVDRLIQEITLRTMDVHAAMTADAEVVVAAARVVGSGVPLPKLEPAFFGSRDATDDETFGLMLRATAFVPYINGFRGAVSIDGERFMDGGLIHRVPLDLIPEGRYDELWIAACSPNGLRELKDELNRARRVERLVIITPTRPLPVGRWTMEWSRISQAIELGRQDIMVAIDEVASTDGPVVVGREREELLAAIGPQDS